jgi:hypothetical protein
MRREKGKRGKEERGEGKEKTRKRGRRGREEREGGQPRKEGGTQQ